jgi:proline dehydrogenase
VNTNHLAVKLSRFSTKSTPLPNLSRGRHLKWASTVLLGSAALVGSYWILDIVQTDPTAMAKKIRSQLPDHPLYQSISLRAPFSDSSNWEVIRSILVFELCGWSWFVQAAPHVFNFTKSIGLHAPVLWIIQNTFFAHFCGGTDVPSLAPSLSRLSKSGIGAILDVSIEADVDHELTDQDVNNHADHAATLFLQSLEAAKVESGTSVAIKLTALGSPTALERVSQVIGQTFHKVRIGTLDKESWKQQFPFLPLSKSSNFSEIDVFLAFSKAFQDETLVLPTLKALGVAAESTDLFLSQIRRVHRLCTYASESNIKLMIDAEQTYFQDAIDTIAFGMMTKHNRKEVPVIFNTYQMYLVEGLFKLKRDLQLCDNHGFHFAGKLVRGAYMNSERSRALTLGLPSPIQPVIEQTHEAYNTGVACVLSKIAKFPGMASIVIATHNRDSVVKAAEIVQKHNLDKKWIQFGQLLGMQDLTAYSLANVGFPVAKYVPYGPVHEVVPYLLRRAQENSGVLGGATIDKSLLWHELICRLKGV